MSLTQPVCWRADVAACQMTDNLFIVREVDAGVNSPSTLRFVVEKLILDRNLRVPCEDFEWHLLDNSSQEKSHGGERLL